MILVMSIIALLAGFVAWAIVAVCRIARGQGRDE